MKGIAAKKWKFQQLFKGLKIEQILAHELKMRFKLLNFARKLFLKLLKKYSPPLPWKIYLDEIFWLILHYKYPNNLYLSKISWHERICEIESRFKIVYFFLIHPVYTILCQGWENSGPWNLQCSQKMFIVSRKKIEQYQ